MDVPHRCWSREVLEALSLDPALFPPIVESADMAGRITPEAAALTGLQAGTPVAAGAADNCAAAVGTGVVAEGSAFITIGTSSVIFAQTSQVEVDPPGRLQTYCAAVPNAWALTSCALSSGLSLRWLRDQVCTEEAREAEKRGADCYALMDEQAAQSPIGANRLIFLPYLMGERSPILDTDARGAFIGLSAMHERRDLIRAVLEGVVYSLRQNMDLLRSLGVTPAKVRLCGGGARSPLWRQMLADVLNLPVSTLQNAESPALGAAILAGVACGMYVDVPSACAALIREDATVLPDSGRHAAYEPLPALLRPLPRPEGLLPSPRRSAGRLSLPGSARSRLLPPVGRADSHLLPPVGRADSHLLPPVGRADSHLLPPVLTRIREP